MRRLHSACWFLLALVAASLPTFGQSERSHSAVSSEELRVLLEKARAKHDLPALAVGRIEANCRPDVAVVGVRKRGADTLATPDDQWHLGSNTKPFTALLVALLIDRGLLEWDTPLEKIFPEQAEKWNDDLKKVTPAHLLTHTSGLPSNGPLGWFQLIKNRQAPLQDRERLVKGLDTIKLNAMPGEKYQYSNLGYVLLGAIIDRRGKASWEDQLEKQVLRPLGVKHWGLGPADETDTVEHPWPHHAVGKPVAADGVMDNPPVMNSAGRVRLSVADYNCFLAEILRLARGEKGLLKPATAQKIFTNPYPVSPHSLSGWLGFRKQPGDKQLVLGHDGSNGLNYCTAVVIPDQNMALCVLTNQGAPGGPGAKVCHEILKELRGTGKREGSKTGAK